MPTKPLTQEILNGDILRIKVFYSRLGEEFAKSLGYHIGNVWYITHLKNKSFLVGKYIRALERYNADGSDTVENVLSNDQIEAIVDDSYRQLEQWNT